MRHLSLNDSVWEQIQQEITFTAQRSRGPGGQNVNRTNSSVQLRWDYNASFSLSSEQKSLVAEKLASWITREGILFLRSDIHRDQEMNKKECQEKLKKLLRQAFFRPKPRKATKPTYSSRLKRKENKQRKSEVKKGRSGRWE